MFISKTLKMRRCTTSQFKKPKETARNVFLQKIFKEKCSLEYSSSHSPGKKSKSQSGRSYHSIKYKPKKSLPKSSHSVSIEEDESDFYEDALDEFFESVKDNHPVPVPVKISSQSLRIKVKQNDGLTVDVSDPITGFKKLQWTKDQLLDNYLEFVFEPNPQLEAKLIVLLGNVPIYAVNKTKGYGDCNLVSNKTDVAVQTSYALLDIDPMESDIYTTQQNYNSALIETTGKQISFDELPYDKEISSYTIKGLNLDCNSVDNTFNYLNPDGLKLSGLREASENTVSCSFTQNSHPNLLATKLRSKSFANLVNRMGDTGTPHTTSLVSSLPSDDIPFSCRQPIPFRKFSAKTAYSQYVDITVINETMTSNDKGLEVTQNGDTLNTCSTMYVNEERLNNLPYASEHYLTEILKKSMRPINFTDEEELNRISESNALCFIENSETSTSCEDVNTDQDGLETSPAIVDLTKFSEERKDDLELAKTEFQEESVYLSPKTPETNFEIKEFGQLTDVVKNKSGEVRTSCEMNTDLDKMASESELININIDDDVESGTALDDNIACTDEEECNQNESENYVDVIKKIGNKYEHETFSKIPCNGSTSCIEESSDGLVPLFLPTGEEIETNKQELNRKNSVQKLDQKVKYNSNSEKPCMSSSNSSVSLEPIMKVLIEDSIQSRSNSLSKECPRSPSGLSKSSNLEGGYKREVEMAGDIEAEEAAETDDGEAVGETDEGDEVDEANIPKPTVTLSATCQSTVLESETMLNGITLTPVVDVKEISKDRSDLKIIETDREFSFWNKRSSKPKCSGSDSDIIQSEACNNQIDKMRPQTTVNANARNIDRPMTSVSQALKGVETALKPLQDQLKEIRTKMASLNNHFYSQYTDDKTKGSNSIFTIGKDTEVLPMKYFAGRPSTRAGQVNGLKSTDVRNETDKRTPNLSRATRYKAISIWSEPEDIIGDSPLPSVNLNFLGTKKTI